MMNPNHHPYSRLLHRVALLLTLVSCVASFAAPQSGWNAMTKEELPSSITADLAVGTTTTIAAFNSNEGSMAVYTTGRGSTKRRTVITSVPARKNTTFAVTKQREGITVKQRDKNNDTLLEVSFLPKSNIMVFKPGKKKTLHLRDTHIRYGIIPSLIGVDLVYDPDEYQEENQLHVPAMNMFVGLADGNDAMMVGVWDKGNQAVKLGLNNRDGKRRISDFSIHMDEKNFSLAFIEHQNLWHAEKLKDTYLETDTEIEWKRPFDARWIGRVHCKESGINYPFYFQNDRRKISGRYTKGWHIMPFWFQDHKTMLHFEKKRPPVGEALIYYLDGHAKKNDVGSPIGIMKQALGSDRALALLDREGALPAQLLKHGHAVCAMLYITLGVRTPYYDDDIVVDESLSYYDDIVTFIDLIRQRIHVFLAYSEDMKNFLNEQAGIHPGFADSLKPMHAILVEMKARKNAIPKTSLNEVRAWTKELKKIRESNPVDIKKFKRFDNMCRRVAGPQDGLAMFLSWHAIEIMEQAAEFAVASPEHCKLAEGIIAKTRKVLRNGTWWEPHRLYWPPKVAAPAVREKEL